MSFPRYVFKPYDEDSLASNQAEYDLLIAGGWYATVALAEATRDLTLPVAASPTQYASPSATGFSVSVASSSIDIQLLLTPTSGFAAGTIVLPEVDDAIDKQEIVVSSTQQITVLTIDGNGATVVGEPASMGADDFFTLKYSEASLTWTRVG